ncbi:trihelix transcription factor GT-4-like [Tasmannia lanceolata]|uniref:trihelix transcription factor GT-4-like n=1 Tax=Tasmannia lanceolata TaxID=3420 RepID=UPI004063026F
MRDRDHGSSFCREKWRNLFRKLKTHHHSPSFSFLKHLSHPFTTFPITKDMEPSSPTLERRPALNGHNISSVAPQEGPLLQNGRNSWNWRDSYCSDVPPSDSEMDCHPATMPRPAGRIIVVKWGEITRKIGIDGSADAIKDAIRSAFGLRSKRSFWVEDEDGVVRSFDRSMPQTYYTLHIDPGVTIKLYHDGDCDSEMMNGEDATLYGEDDFRELLTRHGSESLRQVGTYKDVDSIQELHHMGSYHHSGFRDMKL